MGDGPPHDVGRREAVEDGASVTVLGPRHSVAMGPERRFARFCSNKRPSGVLIVPWFEHRHPKVSRRGALRPNLVWIGRM